MVMFLDEPTGLFENYTYEKILQRFMGLAFVLSFVVIALGKPLYFLYKSKRINSLRLRSKYNTSKIISKGYKDSSLHETDSESLCNNSFSYSRKRSSTISNLRSSLSKIGRNKDIEINSSPKTSLPMNCKIKDSSVKSIKKKTEDEEDEDSFAGILGMQMIHTLEFGISLVSHVASYLRVWAISLAHTELTRIIHGGCLENRLKRGPFVLSILSILYGVLSFFLLIAEGIFTCFLHALRLQWIEFQSKFFKGDGIAYEPFVLKSYEEEKNEN